MRNIRFKSTEFERPKIKSYVRFMFKFKDCLQPSASEAEGDIDMIEIGAF